MIFYIGIKDGFGQVRGAGRHIKIISAATPLRMQVLDSEGRVLLDSKFRAPMATELPIAGAVINLFSDEQQTVEIWYSNQPLDYAQLIAVGANEIRTRRTIFSGGRKKVLDRNPRKSVRVISDKDILIGSRAVGSEGWPVKAGIPQDFETMGEIHCFSVAPQYDWLSLNQSSVEKRPIKTGLGTLIPFNYEVYKQDTYIINNPGQLFRINSANEHTLIFSSGVRFVFKFKSKIFCVRALSNGAYVYSSENGQDWEVVCRVLDNEAAGNLVAAQFPDHNKLVYEWLTIPGQGGNARQQAINVITGEVKKIETAISGQIDYFYHPEEDAFYYWKGLALYKYKDGGSQLILSDFKSAVITETGVMVYRKNNNEVWRLDGEENTKLANSFGNNSYALVYLRNSGGNLFAGMTNGNVQAMMYAGGEGMAETFNVTHNQPFLSPIYNAEGEEIVFARDNSGLVMRKIDAPAIPDFEAAEVRTLEFLV